MKTPELTLGEAGFILLLGAGFTIGMIELFQQLDIWMNNNQQILETIRVATATAEALRVTVTPTPEVTSTPTNPELQATITALVNQITP